MRALSTASILALLVAAVIVALGGAKEAGKELSPTGPISTAQDVAARAKLQTLYTESGLTGSAHPSASQVQRYLAQSEPEDDVGSPHGVLVGVRGSVVVLCTREGTPWTCGAGSLHGGVISYAREATLHAARVAAQKAQASH
jgi:hypothetical protein